MNFKGLILRLAAMLLWGLVWATALPGPAQGVTEKDVQEANRLYLEAATDFHKLYEDSSFRKFEGNWTDTVSKFHNIFKLYPETVRAAQSLYNIGKLYRSLYKWNAKPKFIERSNLNLLLLTKKYPQSYLADDALYEVAKNYSEGLGDEAKAKTFFRRIVDEYPSSELASEAAKLAGIADNSRADTDSETEQYASNEGDSKISTVEDTQTQHKFTEESASTEPPASSGGELPEIWRIDHWSTSEWTRIVINLTKSATYKYNTLKTGKHRFYVDILESKLNPNVKTNLVEDDGIIGGLRASYFNPTTVRIVLDLERYSDIKIFTYQLSRQYKIVLDVLASKTGSGSTSSPTPQAPPKKPDTLVQAPPPLPSDASISLQQALGLKISRIIIDAGHGGRDPGAKGGGEKEKNITLNLALKLKKKIESELADVEVLLTRDRDNFVELEARTAFANKNKGDLFISLHVNSHQSNEARGIETYFLNLTNDKEALRLAAVENSASEKNVSDLQSILNDLMINSKLKESHALATEVQKAMVAAARKSYKSKLLDRGVKQAPFVVLLGATMPSILVEIGFISNEEERKLMTSHSHISAISDGIYNGLLSYISKYSANALAGR